MAELSVFIDESGNFGPYEHHAPHYIITLVFHSQDKVIVYYDNGQKEMTTIVNAVFNSLLEADVRKVHPSDYSLFQAADLFCTLTLGEQKMDGPEGLSTSETEFFLNERTPGCGTAHGCDFTGFEPIDRVPNARDQVAGLPKCAQSPYTGGSSSFSLTSQQKGPRERPSPRSILMYPRSPSRGGTGRGCTPCPPRRRARRSSG